MKRFQAKPILTVCILAIAFSGILLSEYLTTAGSPSWLQTTAREVATACRDSQTQWMVMVCLVIYFMVFLVLERRKASTPHPVSLRSNLCSPDCPHPASGYPLPLPRARYNGRDGKAIFSASPEFFRGKIKTPNVWLGVLVALALLRYSFAYETTPRSLQPLVLLAGIVIGKGASAWGALNSKVQGPKSDEVLFNRPSPTIDRTRIILYVLVFLLAASALWQPEMSNEYQYHGVIRWNGVWNNPNTYGVLMGVGTVLSFGCLVLSWRKHKWLLVLFIVATGLCGFGLVKSYSRGAWLGTVIGILYLFSTFPKVSRLRANRIPLFIILTSALILSFWQFRYTDWIPARRAFSVANINDFSWRNRVEAWSGAGQMMADRPFIGFGWGRAESAYREKYSQLEESAAIQMNDFLMLGISASVPALLCFLMYVALSFGPCRIKLIGDNVTKFKTEPDNKKLATEKSQGLLASPPTLAMICRAGALVMLVGFWFDGGLFKFSVAPVFWILLEMGRTVVAAGVTPAVEGGFLPAGTFPENTSFDEISTSVSPGGTPGSIPHGRDRMPTITWLRWVAAISATLALAMTVLYLGTPLLSVSDGTLKIAVTFLIQPAEKSDFDFLATKPIWRGKPLKTLVEHVRLAHYNRQLINWKLDDQVYREFVLSPEIDPMYDGNLRWRRKLWEFFYPRIRKETDMHAAAEIVLRILNERAHVEPGTNPLTVKNMWRQETADTDGFKALRVAALRSVGIPAQLSESGNVETWSGKGWVKN